MATNASSFLRHAPASSLVPPSPASDSFTSPSSSHNSFLVAFTSPPSSCHTPLPAGEELESVLDVLKSPSREDLVWLDSLTPVSASATDTSIEELADLTTPASTPSTTPKDETSSLHLWPLNGLHLVAARAEDGGAQYSTSDSSQMEIQAKKLVGTNNRKHLPPLSPKAMSLLSDATVRSGDRRKKECGVSVPFNIKASTKDEAMYDGYRWRKYCKKAIKESPFPRFYFKCAAKTCNARKQVQHRPTDPEVVLTTYEGTHNHDPPSYLPVGVVVSGGACACQSSRVRPCLHCLGKNGILVPGKGNQDSD